MSHGTTQPPTRVTPGLTRWRIGVKAYGVVFLARAGAARRSRRSRPSRSASPPVVMVTLETDRIGSQLQESSDVKLRGLIVGEVRHDRGHRRRGRASSWRSSPTRSARIPAERHRPAAAQDPLRRAVRRPGRRAGAGAAQPIQAGDIIPQDRTHAWRSSWRRSSTTCCPLLRTVQPEQARDHPERAVDDARRPGRPAGPATSCSSTATSGAQPQHAGDPGGHHAARRHRRPLCRGGARPRPRGRSRWSPRTRRSSRRQDALRASSPARRGSPTRPRGFLDAQRRAHHPGRPGQQPDPRSCSPKYSPQYPCVALGAWSTGSRAIDAAWRGRAPSTSRSRSRPQRQRLPAGRGAALGRHARPATATACPRRDGSQANPCPGNHFDDGTNQPASGAGSALPRPFPRHCSARHRRRRLRPAPAPSEEQRVVAALLSPVTATAEPSAHPDPARRPDAARHGGEHPMKVKGSSLVKLIVFAAVTLFATASSPRRSPTSSSAPRRPTRPSSPTRRASPPGQDVRIAGVRVGEVTDVSRRPRRDVRGRHAEIDFSVLKTSVLTQGTEVTIKYRNLVGQRYLALTPGRRRPRALADGATIPPRAPSRRSTSPSSSTASSRSSPRCRPSDVNELSGLIIQTSCRGRAATSTPCSPRPASPDVRPSPTATPSSAAPSTTSTPSSAPSTPTTSSCSRSSTSSSGSPAGSPPTARRSAARCPASTPSRPRPPTCSSRRARSSRTTSPSCARSPRRSTSRPTSRSSRTSSPARRRRIATLTRTATYGSWFNFYLCKFEARCSCRSCPA